jgi:UDP-N-acetylmuramate--alanine ligase
VTDAPLTGRRIYFVGIGGAGLSAYANIARAWGAEVRGWDVRETIFMDTLDGIDVDVGGEPRTPSGFETVISTAHLGRVEGRPRAQFLAELVSLRQAIVVGGAHGKTTTAAMIAYVLRQLGGDPSWIVGGVVPQLGGNAGTGSGWLVVEGDESDRSIALLRPEIAVVTNVELDHHATFGLGSGACGLLRGVAEAQSRGRSSGTSLRPTSSSPFPAITTGGMRPRRSQRSSWPVWIVRMQSVRSSRSLAWTGASS